LVELFELTPLVFSHDESSCMTRINRIKDKDRHDDMMTDRALSLAIFRVEGLPGKNIIFVREHGYGPKEGKFSGFTENYLSEQYFFLKLLRKCLKILQILRKC